MLAEPLIRSEAGYVRSVLAKLALADGRPPAVSLPNTFVAFDRYAMASNRS